jgi:hypothetical protein
MNHFTEKELEDFKKGSLPFPYFIYEETPEKVTEVMEVVSISGMASNGGLPTEISIYHHKKGKTTKRLTYKLKK